MDMTVLFRGIALGFAIAAPVGPIGVLCIRRTLANGMPHGLISGLGAATADVIYGSIAAFGLTAISSLLVDQQQWLRLAGGAFLLYLGLRSLLAKPVESSTSIADSSPVSSLTSAYGSALILTLTNPMTIISFAGIMAGMGVNASTGQGGMLVLGVFLGSALWWLTLSAGVGLVRKRLGHGVLLWVNRLSGLVIIGFGVWSLVSAVG